MKTASQFNIDYTLPVVTLLQHSGLGVAEIAGRTCYDSFENSENIEIQNFHHDLRLDLFDTFSVNQIESSELLDSLAWVHHHHSIIEHATVSFLVQGVSRGVLQEHARHRLQNISVRSTRYTMSSILNAFVTSVESWHLQDYKHADGKVTREGRDYFIETVLELDMLVTADEKYNAIEIGSMWDKLFYQRELSGREDFLEMTIAKSSLPIFDAKTGEILAFPEKLFKALQEGKKKRNVGDGFKHIVTDNWKVDMVITFNLRSLKNYFDLRDSGSAWFQIQWLAQAMKEATPVKYLRLIDKKHKPS